MRQDGAQQNQTAGNIRLQAHSRARYQRMNTQHQGQHVRREVARLGGMPDQAVEPEDQKKTDACQDVGQREIGEASKLRVGVGQSVDQPRAQEDTGREAVG